MAWATPILHAVGDILTASDWNISSNDIAFLGGATGAGIATTQTTTATSYGNLTTVGPSVTLTTGANALVSLSAQMQSANGLFMGQAVSGATTIAASDGQAVGWNTPAGSQNIQISFTFLIASLTPGSNTFTAQYRATAGTGQWANRNITVVPLP